MISVLEDLGQRGQNFAVLWAYPGHSQLISRKTDARVNSDQALPETDEDLMCRAAGGDQAALAQIYDRYAPRLLGLALTVLRDRRDAEDAVQDAFVYAWQHAASYDRSRGKVLSWLAIVVRHRAIDRLRSQERRERLVTTAGQEQLPQAAAGGNTPGELASDEAEKAMALLNGLPDPQREVLKLAFLQGLTQQEIAERTQSPIGTIKTHIRRGLQRLRSALGTNTGKGGAQ